jgi:hypothetical protein
MVILPLFFELCKFALIYSQVYAILPLFITNLHLFWPLIRGKIAWLVNKQGQIHSWKIKGKLTITHRSRGKNANAPKYFWHY